MKVYFKKPTGVAWRRANCKRYGSSGVLHYSSFDGSSNIETVEFKDPGVLKLRKKVNNKIYKKVHTKGIKISRRN